jgi:hypothetical protein
MDFLRLIDAKLGRWLAYADSCVNAEGELARCQPFWTFVAIVLGVICVAALVGVVARTWRDRRKGAPPPGGKYTRPY